MSSPPPVELFKGTNWEECHKFILAVRARALWEGQQRDPAWIADFAAPLFWRKALSWHCRLPEDVRQDWSKLEIALIDRWPEPEDDDEPQMEPTPAAAPSLTPDDEANRTFQGILKAVVDGLDTSYYVEPPAKICLLSSDKNKALRVRCNSLCGTTLLERTDHPSHSWLVVEWAYASSNPNIGDGSAEHACMTHFDSDTLKSAWGGSTPFQLLRCTVLANGEVIPRWKKDDGTSVALVPYIGSGRYLHLVPDPKAYARENVIEKRAKLFIEPVN